MTDESEEGDLCPECEGYRGKKLGLHWARSKDCDYPPLSLDDEAILNGMFFVGGSLNGRKLDSNCYASIVHHDLDVLEWMAEHLGVLAASITEFDQSGSVEYYGGEPKQTLWEFRTRSLPALDSYLQWYDHDDNRTVPDDITARPLMLKTACLLAARRMSDRPGIYLSLRRTQPSEMAVQRVFEGYAPRIRKSSDGGYVVRLYNSTDLCKDLSPWPTFARDRFDADSINEGQLRCRYCGGRFRTAEHVCHRIEGGKVVRVDGEESEGIETVVHQEGGRAWLSERESDGPRMVEWTQEECIRALLKEYQSVGRFPTNPDYNDTQKGREDLPSLATLYARFGRRGRWIDAMRTEALPVSILEPGERQPETLIDKDRRLLTYYEDVLPDKERIDVNAVLVDGVSIPEQGNKREISRKVVHKNVRRARQRFRELASADGIAWAPGTGQEYPLPESAAEIETDVTWIWAGDEEI